MGASLSPEASFSANRSRVTLAACNAASGTLQCVNAPAGIAPPSQYGAIRTWGPKAPPTCAIALIAGPLVVPPLTSNSSVPAPAPETPPGRKNERPDQGVKLTEMDR